MGSIKFSVHPLFFVFGFYYALTGRIFLFVAYTVTAVIHETGHAYVSGNLGYRLNKITLMPFGAVVSGNIDGLKSSDEIKIALAGPLLNLAIALFFIAVWWIFPESYAFTDIAAEANLTMAFVNFIPAYPLDGGRIVCAVIENKFGKEKAFKICRVLGIVFSAALAALFVLTLFFTPNYSILLFALFVFFGAVSKEKDNVYVSVFSSLDTEKLKRGMRVVRIAVDENVTIKKLVSMLDSQALNEVVVYKNAEAVTVIGQKRITEIVGKGDLYAKLEKYV